MKGGLSLKNRKQAVRKQQGYDNVFIFPGLVQRLLEEAQTYLFQGMPEEAIERYEEIERLEPANMEFYDLYVLAMYEAGEHSRLIPYARIAIESMESDAFELFKLLNLSLLQLGRFEEIEDLLEEASAGGEYDREGLVVLREYIDSEMNRTIMSTEVTVAKTPTKLFTVEQLSKKDPYEQLARLNEVQHGLIEAHIDELVMIVESFAFPTFVRTSAFLLLKEIDYHHPISFDKYELTGKFIPKEVPQLGEDSKTSQVLPYLNDVLAKKPSLLAYALESYEQVVYLLYPHTWPETFESSDIAEAFVHHVNNLVSGSDETSSEDPLLNFIQKIVFQEDI